MPEPPFVHSSRLQIVLDLREPFEPQLIAALTQAKASFEGYVNTIDDWLDVLHSSDDDLEEDRHIADDDEDAADEDEEPRTFGGIELAGGLIGVAQEVLLKRYPRALNTDDVVNELGTEYQSPEAVGKIRNALYNGKRKGLFTLIGKGYYRPVTPPVFESDNTQ